MNLTALAAQCEFPVLVYSAGHSMSPLLMSSMISWGARPSTVHPTDWAVPRISFITPDNSFDLDLGLMILAALMMSSMEILPLCLMFLTFFLSRGGSLRALMMRAAAEGTTSTLPPTALRQTILISLGSNLGGMLKFC